MSGAPRRPRSATRARRFVFVLHLAGAAALVTADFGARPGVHLAHAAGGDAKGGKAVPVPPEIHTFWAGGPMPQGDLANLEQWGRASHAAGDRYHVTLWTSPETHGRLGKVPDGGGPSQLDTLATAGVAVRTDTEAAIPKKLRPYYREALRTQSYAMASDLARYGVLEQHGGIYVDTDMAPGSVDLTRPPPKLPRAGVPVFAPSFRTEADWNRAAEQWRRSHPGQAPTNVDVVGQLYAGGINNGFIMAPPHAAFMGTLNDRVYDKLRNSTYPRIEHAPVSPWGKVTGKTPRPTFNVRFTTNDAANLTGPRPVEQAIKASLGDPSATSAQIGAAASVLGHGEANWVNMQRKTPTSAPATGCL